MAELKETHDVSINWRSFELRPGDGPPLPESYRQAILQKRPAMQQMAREHFGVEINEGPFGINSRPALVGAKYAEAMGHGPVYHEAMLRAYWQEAKDISDPTVLRQVAESVGLDGDAFMAALDDLEYQMAVDYDIDYAHRLRISGVPALLFENKYLVGGAQTYDSLIDILQQIEAAESAV